MGQWNGDGSLFMPMNAVTEAIAGLGCTVLAQALPGVEVRSGALSRDAGELVGVDPLGSDGGWSARQVSLPLFQPGNLALQPLQFAVDARQLRFRQPSVEVVLPVFAPDHRFHLSPEKPQPWVAIHRAFAAVQPASLDREKDLVLRQPELFPRRLVAEGRSLMLPFGIQVIH